MLSHYGTAGITEREKKNAEEIQLHSHARHFLFLFFFEWSWAGWRMAAGRASQEFHLREVQRDRAPGPHFFRYSARRRKPNQNERYDKFRIGAPAQSRFSMLDADARWSWPPPTTTGDGDNRYQLDRQVVLPAARLAYVPPATRWSTAPRVFLAGRAHWSQQPPPSSAAPPSHQIKHRQVTSNQTFL